MSIGFQYSMLYWNQIANYWTGIQYSMLCRNPVAYYCPPDVCSQYRDAGGPVLLGICTTIEGLARLSSGVQPGTCQTEWFTPRQVHSRGSFILVAGMARYIYQSITYQGDKRRKEITTIILLTPSQENWYPTCRHGRLNIAALFTKSGVLHTLPAQLDVHGIAWARNPPHNSVTNALQWRARKSWKLKDGHTATGTREDSLQSKPSKDRTGGSQAQTMR